MAFSRLPDNFEEALAEVKSWRASHRNAKTVLAEDAIRNHGSGHQPFFVHRTMTDKEVMQQALECIERLNMRGRILADFEDEVYASIDALKAALAQPEQEPSVWRDMVVVSLVREGINKHKAMELADHFAAQQQVEPDAYGYASRFAVAIWEQHYKDVAPQWKPLDDLMGVLTQIDNMTSGLTRLAQPEQKPVSHSVIAGALFDFMGWLTSRKERLALSSVDDASPAVDAITDFAKMRGLSLDDARVLDWHTTSPAAQRPWQGLTSEDLAQIDTDEFWQVGNHMAIAMAVEDKLKERNNA